MKSCWRCCASIDPRSGDVPFFSTVTGGLLDTAELDGEYWYRNMREPVLFARVTRALLEDGQRAFIEVSPHPVLTVGVQETVDEVVGDPGEALVVGSLRREQGGSERFLTSLAEAWVHGVERRLVRSVRAPVRGGSPCRPTLFSASATGCSPRRGSGDAASIGLSAADHPLLGAAVAVAGDRGWLFTGRLSLESHPWLAEYTVMDTALLPGAGYVELALAAAERSARRSWSELDVGASDALRGQGRRADPALGV